MVTIDWCIMIHSDPVSCQDDFWSDIARLDILKHKKAWTAFEKDCCEVKSSLLHYFTILGDKGSLLNILILILFPKRHKSTD